MNIKPFSKLIFIMNNKCNFHCKYCWPLKGDDIISEAVIDKALKLLLSYFQNSIQVIFYGGEPLFSFDQIKFIVDNLQQNIKKDCLSFDYHITTNGSLLSEKVLDFFQIHRFQVVLSFDGYAQNKSRKIGSYTDLSQKITKILNNHPGIPLATNSVFMPQTVSYLFQSIRLVVELGVKDVQIAFAEDCIWDDAHIQTLKSELIKLVEYLSEIYYEKDVPVNLFKRSEGKVGEGVSRRFQCMGGIDRMVVDHWGDLWGCFQFNEYFRKTLDPTVKALYAFGNVMDERMDFEENYRRVMPNYLKLRQSVFVTTENTSCFLCDHIEMCSSCPVYSARLSRQIGMIPVSHCQFQSLLSEIKELYSSYCSSQNISMEAP